MVERRLTHRCDAFPGEGLGEADRVTRGLADVGVVQEPVNGRSRKGFGHELVEPGRVQVRRHGDGAFLVGGIDEAIETLGGVGPDFEKPDVINHDQIGAEYAGDDTVDGVVGAVRADQGAEVFEAEPRDSHAGFDDLLAEGFEEESLAGSAGPANDDVLLPADPFQRAQRLLRRRWDRGRGSVPGIEGLPGREAGRFAAAGEHGPEPAGDGP